MEASELKDETTASNDETITPRDDGLDVPPMEELQPVFKAHAELCQAMANEHRLAILYTLCGGERCVSDIAADIGISVHNVSQHLRVLKERQIVRSRKEAQTVYYSITNFKFIEACMLMRQALVEEHQSHGESLLAAELLDAIQRMPQPVAEQTTSTT
jgi:DNA-binding transcriptional ArsR family regulator